MRAEHEVREASAGICLPPQQAEHEMAFKDSAGGGVRVSHVRFQKTLLQRVWVLQGSQCTEEQKREREKERERQERHLQTICHVKHREK